MVLEDHESSDEDGGLQKSSQAQTDDLLHPANEAIQIAPGDAEHIQRAHGDLNEQNAASLEVGKKHFQHCISHQNHAEQDHDGAGDDIQTEMGAVHRVRERLDLAELCDDVLAHLSDASAIAGESRGKGPLQRHGQCVQPNGNHREEAHRQETLDNVEGALLQIASACGVFNAALKGADYYAHSKERPAQTGEEQHDGVYPVQLKQFHAHVAHEGEEVAEKAHDLPVDPVHQLIQHRRGNKIPDKYGWSPPPTSWTAATPGQRSVPSLEKSVDNQMWHQRAFDNPDCWAGRHTRIAYRCHPRYEG